MLHSDSFSPAASTLLANMPLTNLSLKLKDNNLQPQALTNLAQSKTLEFIDIESCDEISRIKYLSDSDIEQLLQIPSLVHIMIYTENLFFKTKNIKTNCWF